MKKELWLLLHLIRYQLGSINKHKPVNEKHEDEGHKVHNLEVRSPKFIHHL